MIFRGFEDAHTKEHEHLQANLTKKATCNYNLAEDAHSGMLEHLQA